MNDTLKKYKQRLDGRGDALAVCLGAILAGVLLIDSPTYCAGQFDYCMDFSPYNKPAGAALIAIGCFFATVLVMKKRPMPICPICEVIFPKPPQNNKCPTCKVDLEPLEGFYKRHPEKKGEKQQP